MVPSFSHDRVVYNIKHTAGNGLSGIENNTARVYCTTFSLFPFLRVLGIVVNKRRIFTFAILVASGR